MGGQTISNESPRINALQVTTSTYGQAIPIIWGTTRISANLIDYQDYTAIANTSTEQGGGKGGGTQTTNTQYTYTTAVSLLLCEGPVEKIGRIWTNKAVEKIKRRDIFTIPSSGILKITPPDKNTFDSDVGVYCPDGDNPPITGGGSLITTEGVGGTATTSGGD